MAVIIGTVRYDRSWCKIRAMLWCNLLTPFNSSFRPLRGSTTSGLIQLLWAIIMGKIHAMKHWFIQVRESLYSLLFSLQSRIKRRLTVGRWQLPSFSMCRYRLIVDQQNWTAGTALPGTNKAALSLTVFNLSVFSRWPVSQLCLFICSCMIETSTSGNTLGEDGSCWWIFVLHGVKRRNKIFRKKHLAVRHDSSLGQSQDRCSVLAVSGTSFPFLVFTLQEQVIFYLNIEHDLWNYLCKIFCSSIAYFFFHHQIHIFNNYSLIFSYIFCCSRWFRKRIL